MKLQLIKLGLVTAALAGFACTASTSNQSQPETNRSGSQAAAPANAGPTSEKASATSGKDLYAVHCMTCHKMSGKGGKVTVEGKTLDPDDLTSANMKSKSDEKLYNYIAEGIVDEGMPAFKDTLTSEEIRSVVAHLRSLQTSGL